jgi:hypothetical protein
MPSYLPKVLRMRMAEAVKAVGDGESFLDVMDTLIETGAIRSYDTILEIKVDRDKAVAIENYFLLQTYKVETSSIKKKRNSDDY